MRIRLKDHAGVVHEVDLSRNDLLPATHPSDADPVARARIAFSRLETELQPPALGLQTLFWIAVWIAAGTLAWFSGIPLWISLPGMAIGAALLLAAVNALRPDREPRPADSPAHRAFVEAALAARLCPVCAYPLIETHDELAHATCSECSAEWQLSSPPT